jgi:hypothetical protein
MSVEVGRRKKRCGRRDGARCSPGLLCDEAARRQSCVKDAVSGPVGALIKVQRRTAAADDRSCLGCLNAARVVLCSAVKETAGMEPSPTSYAQLPSFEATRGSSKAEARGLCCCLWSAELEGQTFGDGVVSRTGETRRPEN